MTNNSGLQLDIYSLTRSQVDIPNINFFTHGGRRTNRSQWGGCRRNNEHYRGAKLSTPDPNGELPYVGSNVSIAAGTGGGVVVGDGGVCGLDRVVGIAYIDVITVLVTIDQF